MKKILYFCAFCAIVLTTPAAIAQVDSCGCGGIHYTDKQDANCLECLHNKKQMQTNLNACREKNEKLQEKFDVCHLHEELLTEENGDLKAENAKEQRSKRIWRSVGLGAIAVAILEAALIFILF